MAWGRIVVRTVFVVAVAASTACTLLFDVDGGTRTSPADEQDVALVPILAPGVANDSSDASPIDAPDDPADGETDATACQGTKLVDLVGHMAVSVAGTGATWARPADAIALDDKFAQTGAITTNLPSQYLIVSNFGVVVPQGAVVAGVVVKVWRKQIGTAARDSVVSLAYNGQLVGRNKAAPNAVWPVATDVAVYGSLTNTWEVASLDAMIQSPLFGVAIAVTSAAQMSALVDAVTITVHLCQ